VRLDPERARRVLARSRVLAQEREHEQWLAGLTPQHRGFHERNAGFPCGECIQEGAESLGRSLARLAASVERSMAASAAARAEREARP
jgi:hypothetical protein